MALDTSLYQPGIFDYFKNGCDDAAGEAVSASEFFRGVIGSAYYEIADHFDCSVLLSATRVEEARVHWARDLPRIDIEGSKTPDHFKNAGFLAYWLRRRVVVEIASRVGKGGTDKQTHFIGFANEICAFVVGFRLSLYFHYRRRIESGPDASKFLVNIELQDDLRHDVVTLLRHKEVSPHALYLIFAALFTDIEKPRGSLNVVRLARKAG